MNQINILEKRYYQEDAVKAFFKYTQKNWGKHPIVVLPTGSGKSYVQAKIIEIMLDYPNTRILLLTHRKTLIQQNYDELTGYLNDRLLDVGIFSAGLKRRETRNRIIFAGIQSVHSKAWELGFFDLILVDECHLIKHKVAGTYRFFLAEMQKINPKVVIGGLTATQFRTGTGVLTEGEDKLFDDVCHETTCAELMNPEHPKNKDNKRYLCPLVSPDKETKHHADISKVHIRGGEFVQHEMQSAFNRKDLIERTVAEIIVLSKERKKILVFTTGIDHCEAVAAEFEKYEVTVGFVHSKRKDAENDKTMEDFSSGKIRFLCNIDFLTTGFNEKAIDCLCVLRAILSPGLLVQIGGRGFRLHSDKDNCLFLDYGMNILRHGPIDKIEVVKSRSTGKKTVVSHPQKDCPICQSIMAIQTMTCPDCGHQFPQKEKHEDEASTAEVISTWMQPEPVSIEYTMYRRHQGKDGKPDTLRVDYFYGDIVSYSEWISMEHPNPYVKGKALSWIKQRTDKSINNIDEAIAESENFRKVIEVIVDLNEKFPRIKGYRFEDIEEKPAELVPLPMPEVKAKDTDTELDEAMGGLF